MIQKGNQQNASIVASKRTKTIKMNITKQVKDSFAKYNKLMKIEIILLSEKHVTGDYNIK